MKLIAAGTLALALATTIAQPRIALAWGDDGHKVVALIAQSYLDADVRKSVNALLAADTDSLTTHDKQLEWAAGTGVDEVVKYVSDEYVKRSERLYSALSWLLGPPFGLLALGLMTGWVAIGFRGGRPRSVAADDAS